MKQLAEVLAFKPRTRIIQFPTQYCSCPVPFPIRHEFKGYRYCMNCEFTIKEGS